MEIEQGLRAAVAMAQSANSVSARLDSLPFCGFHVRLLVIGGLGYLFDAMDVAIIAFILPVLKVRWHLAADSIGYLAAAASIGGIAGASIGGWLGDLIGRRSVMMWALAIYCLATFASAFTHTWQSFMLWRIVAGTGTSAESAIVAPFLAEFAAPGFRGRYIGALVSFFSFGFVAAATLGYLLVPSYPEAWRYALIATALPIGMLLWWRRSLPESPRWLQSKGRVAEAERILASIEEECRVQRSRTARQAEQPLLHERSQSPRSPREPRTTAHRPGAGVLFSARFVRTTSMTLLAWFAIGFAYYAFFTWIPSLLVDGGRSVTGSYAYALIIYAAQIPGYLSATALNDVIGRRAVTATYMLSGGIAAVWLALAPTNSAVLLAASLVSFFMNGTYAGLYAYTPELFPTEIRATAHGMAAATSRVAAALSPIAIGYLYPVLGFTGVFGMSSGVLLSGAVGVLVLGVATTNLSLEEITLD